jgi:hypothetical protein
MFAVKIIGFIEIEQKPLISRGIRMLNVRQRRINLRNCLCDVQLITPPRNSSISLILIKISHLWVGNTFSCPLKLIEWVIADVKSFRKDYNLKSAIMRVWNKNTMIGGSLCLSQMGNVFLF